MLSEQKAVDIKIIFPRCCLPFNDVLFFCAATKKIPRTDHCALREINVIMIETVLREVGKISDDKV